MDQHQNDERIWSSEVEALAYEASLDAIVDAVRLSSQRLSELKRIGIGKLNFRLPGPFSDLGWGVEETHLQGAATTWDQSA